MKYEENIIGSGDPSIQSLKELGQKIKSAFDRYRELKAVAEEIGGPTIKLLTENPSDFGDEEFETARIILPAYKTATAAADAAYGVASALMDEWITMNNALKDKEKVE